MTNKRFAAICLILGIGMLTFACSQKTASSVTDDILDISKDEPTAHTVAITSSADAIAPDRIKDGIISALKAHYNDRITINRKDTAGAELIIAIGEDALSQVSSDTQTPIVAAEIRDYKSLLGAAYANPEEDHTGTNITGIDVFPDQSAQLSLMIESTKKLECVGLLYSPEDSFTIRQNRGFEVLLDEAGIPWKEYILPSERYREYIEASKKEKKKNKEKFAPLQEEIEKNSEFYPLTPAISQNWTGGKGALGAEPSDYATRLPKKATSKKIIKYACKECSTLYIPSHSSLRYLYKSICQTASKRSVTTLGGDVISGKYSLVSLYTPESEVGYLVGQYAIDILDNQRDPAEMDILSFKSIPASKLYNEKTAMSFGLEFPKSFKKYSDRFQ